MMTTPIQLVQLMRTLWITAALAATATTSAAAEQRVTSPDGRLTLILSDAGGLNCRVEVDGQPLLQSSRLGLEFAGGVSLGPAATIQGAETARYDGTWENLFGKRRIVRDRWNEIHLTLDTTAMGTQTATGSSGNSGKERQLAGLDGPP